MHLEMSVSKILAHGRLWYTLQNYQNFIEITSNMIYIVALGGGFKCPRKIHLNTQCPTSFSAHTSIESPFKLMEISWHENENRVIAKSCGTLYNLQLLFFLQIQKQFLESVLDMNLKMEVILIISILLSLMFAINSGQKNS